MIRQNCFVKMRSYDELGASSRKPAIPESSYRNMRSGPLPEQNWPCRGRLIAANSFRCSLQDDRPSRLNSISRKRTSHYLNMTT